MSLAALAERVALRTMAYDFRVWGFGEGIAVRALLGYADRVGDPSPVAFAHGLVRAWLGRGIARTAEDHVAPGVVLLDFHRRTGDPVFLDAARRLAALNAGFACNSQGARLHRADQPGWKAQIWVDCMDVDGPFLSRLAGVTGEERYARQAMDELLGYARLLQDEQSGLFWHGFETAAGRNGQPWARGQGWALMGLLDSLAALPRALDGWNELHQRLTRLVEALQRTQGADGLWRTIVTDEESYAESTLAAMAAYALREGAAHGLLAGDMGQAMKRAARAALVTLVDDTGALTLVSDATPVAERNVYRTRPFGVFPWGQGPLLLALTQDLPG